MSYCTQTDLEIVFGAENINKWADADNLEDNGDILARIAWAIEDAQSDIDSRLSVRFTTPLETVPTLIKMLCTKLAGVKLYEFPRGIADGEESQDFSAMKQEVDETLSKILNDQRSIGLTPLATSAPDVLVFEGRSVTENA